MQKRQRKHSALIWITEEWLVILIAILLLLAIAISAAGARTLMPTRGTVSTSTQQPLATSFGEDPLE
jgi:hypothetical protein